jgi:polyhydroxyalkanoate synthase
MSPEAWHSTAEERAGSWWPALTDWLKEHSSGESAPPPMGKKTGRYRPIEPAPGSYVFQR